MDFLTQLLILAIQLEGGEGEGRRGEGGGGRGERGEGGGEGGGGRRLICNLNVLHICSSTSSTVICMHKKLYMYMYYTHVAGCSH